MKQAYIINEKGIPVPILQIWQSNTDWYWYITEHDGENTYGLVSGVEKEWGSISLEELKGQKNKIWKVLRKDWNLIKDIIMLDSEEKEQFCFHPGHVKLAIDIQFNQNGYTTEDNMNVNPLCGSCKKKNYFIMNNLDRLQTFIDKFKDI